MDTEGHAARREWSLTRHAFDALLTSLGPDRDAAANRYLEIRRTLVRLFEWRGCSTPDDYADEALNRCARRIADGEDIRDVATYAIGVARMLLREKGRERARQPQSLDNLPEPGILPPEVENELEMRVECLQRCLTALPEAEREIILTYYQGDKGEKITNRKGLMRRLGILSSTLRMRALRLREKLHSCTQSCLEGRKTNSFDKILNSPST